MSYEHKQSEEEVKNNEDNEDSDDSSQALSLLEKAACPILDSYMRGASFQSALSRFYELHAPKFSDFEPDEEFRLDQQGTSDDYAQLGRFSDSE